MDSAGQTLTADLNSKKYIVFYYTASWWGACGPVTSQLVKWYKDNKNDSFELIAVTYDRKEKAFLNYLSKKKVNFPSLQFQHKGLEEVQKHASKYIPSFAMINQSGKVVVKGVGAKIIPQIEQQLAK